MKLTNKQITNMSDQELEQLHIDLQQRVNTDPDWQTIENYQQVEREQLRRVVECGTLQQKRELAQRNHKGITRALWYPGRSRYYSTNEEE